MIAAFPLVATKVGHIVLIPLRAGLAAGSNGVPVVEWEGYEIS